MLFGQRTGASDTFAIAGAWQVIDIAAPHPFGQYTIDLRADGGLEWAARVPTTDGAEFEVTGSGSWRSEGDKLHYTSGESRGALRWSHEDEHLVLDGLPATKVGPGVRCVLERR
jgi:hypothetical protein